MPDILNVNDDTTNRKERDHEPSFSPLLDEWLKERTGGNARPSPGKAGGGQYEPALYIGGLAGDEETGMTSLVDRFFRCPDEKPQTPFDPLIERVGSARPPKHPKYDSAKIDPTDPFDGKGWEQNIRPSGVAQGGYGDCFFLSALASLANSESGKKHIRDMISTNADGSYSVTFPGDRNHPVTVTKSDLLRAGTRDGSTWANILETAFLKYNEGAGTREAINDFLPTVQNMPLLGKAASASDALELLTDKPVTTVQLGFLDIGDRRLGLGATSKENVAQDLERALADGQPITATTAGNWMKHLGLNSPGPVPDFHVFSVLSYDSKTQTVVVRNPWGHNNDTALSREGTTVDGITNLGDGKLSMSLDTFMERFSNVNIAGTGDYQSSARHIVSDLERMAGHAKDAIVDVFHGDFSDALDNGWDVLRSYYRLGSDELHLATRFAWDVGSGVVHIVADGAEEVVDGAKAVGSGIASVAEGAWDAASDAVGAVGKGAGAVVGTLGSAAGSALDALTDLL